MADAPPVWPGAGFPAFGFGGVMPLSNCDPGCPVAGAPPVWPGAGFPALGFGGDMPLSNWDPGCPDVGAPPVWPGVGLPVLWLGGVMPLSIWDPGCCGAGAPPPFWSPPPGPAPGCVAPPLGCAMTQRGVAAAITAMTPTAGHSTQIHLLKRKTPHPRLEPPAPRNYARVRSQGPLQTRQSEGGRGRSTWRTPSR